MASVLVDRQFPVAFDIVIVVILEILFSYILDFSVELVYSYFYGLFFYVERTLLLFTLNPYFEFLMLLHYPVFNI